MVSTYGIFLFRQACITVPNEMLDAARLDGCSEFGIYFRVVMPLVRPMAAAFCLVAFLANWNAFFAPNIFLHSDDKLTVPVVLNLLLGVYRQKQGIFLAGTALAMIPPRGAVFLPAERVHQRPDVGRRQRLRSRPRTLGTLKPFDSATFHWNAGSGVTFPGLALHSQDPHDQVPMAIAPSR